MEPVSSLVGEGIDASEETLEGFIGIDAVDSTFVTLI
jgi:hypothetical protein